MTAAWRDWQMSNLNVGAISAKSINSEYKRLCMWVHVNWSDRQYERPWHLFLLLQNVRLTRVTIILFCVHSFPSKTILAVTGLNASCRLKGHLSLDSKANTLDELADVGIMWLQQMIPYRLCGMHRTEVSDELANALFKAHRSCIISFRAFRRSNVSSHGRFKTAAVKDQDNDRRLPKSHSRSLKSSEKHKEKLQHDERHHSRRKEPVNHHDDHEMLHHVSLEHGHELEHNSLGQILSHLTIPNNPKRWDFKHNTSRCCSKFCSLHTSNPLKLGTRPFRPH